MNSRLMLEVMLLIGPMNNSRLVSIDVMTLDTRLQMRDKTDPLLVKEYRKFLEGWDPHNHLVKPPLGCVKIVYDGIISWLVDGWHRIEAAKELSLTHYPAVVEPGTFEDALWKSIGANGEHGKPRTDGEKRRAVETALRHPRAKGMSDGAIAAACRVSQPYLSEIRNALLEANEIEKDPITTGKNGKKYKERAKKPHAAKPSLATVTSDNSEALANLDSNQVTPNQKPPVAPTSGAPIPPNDMIYVNRHHCYHALDCECHKDCLSSGEIVSADNTDLDDMFA